MQAWNKFKKTPFYYWIVLVIWPAIREAFTASETRGRAMDILITLIVAAITVYYFHLGSVDVGTNFITVLLVLGTAILLRILSNVLYIPAKLYFDARRNQDRFAWDDIYVEKKVFRLNRKIRGYGISIRSEKPFPYDALVQMPYFEVDGYSHQDDSHLATQGQGRRLKWVENPSPHSASPALLIEDSGEATFYLFDTDPGNLVYSISFWERTNEQDQMDNIFRKIESHCRGELNIRLSCAEGVTAQDYNFEMVVDFLGNVKMKIRKGRILSYKPRILDEK